MSVISYFQQKNDIDGNSVVPFNYNSASGFLTEVAVDNNMVLPIVFIESSIVDKLKYKSIDYKRLFARYCNLGASKKDIEEFNNIIGAEESIALSVLNRKMKNVSYYKFLNFSLSENDYAREALKLADRLTGYYSNNATYVIENDENGFFIIMNENSFIDFDTMYRSLSRDLCERMLQFIDESFVYQSVYFKSL